MTIQVSPSVRRKDERFGEFRDFLKPVAFRDTALSSSVVCPHMPGRIVPGNRRVDLCPEGAGSPIQPERFREPGFLHGPLTV